MTPDASQPVPTRKKASAALQTLSAAVPEVGLPLEVASQAYSKAKGIYRRVNPKPGPVNASIQGDTILIPPPLDNRFHFGKPKVRITHRQGMRLIQVTPAPSLSVFEVVSIAAVGGIFYYGYKWFGKSSGTGLPGGYLDPFNWLLGYGPFGL